MLTFGSLFAGIGGFDLGFERAGMLCKWQVEIDRYCQKVLAKHWPDVRRHDDVRTWPQPDAERVDVICGGFPCQDISAAGRGAGIEGSRSGLWAEFARIVRILRPRFVVVENSPELRRRGLGRVLGDLAENGFDAEWDCISAGDFGAKHIRERLFILADLRCQRRRPRRYSEAREKAKRTSQANHFERCRQEFARFWEAEPELVRIVHGVSAGLDRRNRIHALGNAVVPQVAEYIGRLINTTESKGTP